LQLPDLQQLISCERARQLLVAITSGNFDANTKAVQSVRQIVRLLDACPIWHVEYDVLLTEPDIFVGVEHDPTGLSCLTFFDLGLE
jgi:hypothetical protein